MSYSQQIQQEIQKHERLIASNERQLAQHMIDRSLIGDCPMTINRCIYARAHMKHCQFMIQIFNYATQRDVARLKIAIRCMKANASDIEDSMSELAKVGDYTEQEYIEHMNRFKGEIEQWDRF